VGRGIFSFKNEMGTSNFRLQVNFCLHQLNYRLLQFCRQDQLKSVDVSSDVDKNLGIDIITDSVSKMG
jgi:hypothetical protein